MNFVFILPDKDAGVASVIRNLTRYRSSKFYTKVILLHNHLEDPARRINGEFNVDETIRLSYDGKWSSRFGVLKNIKDHLNEKSIIISNDGGLDLEVVKYFKLEIPVVYIMHGDYRHYYNVIREKGDLISSFITVSDYLKDQVLALQNNNPSKSRFKLSSIKFPVPDIKKSVKIKSKELRLAFVGSLIEAKGVLKLKIITELLDKRNINYHLNIIGSGPEKGKLRTLFHKNDKVTLVGKLSNEEVIKRHEKHDILLLPSSGEGLPVVVVEAMKCGVVPMATSLKSGIPELIEHKVNGYTVDLNHPNQYADYIEELSKEREKLSEMSAICKKKANQMFNPWNQTQAYENCIAATLPVKGNITTLEKILGLFPLALENRLKKIIFI
ncbi:glycosyltransferase family 4 protein [Christiangramia sp. ASW11-125]|uniref:glycosyltransferase family 4 protein n=1 Tax=Christiangramia sp. ASW11-125 TaxID=3400701 RepID=UPI003AAA7C5E